VRYEIAQTFARLLPSRIFVEAKWKQNLLRTFASPAEELDRGISMRRPTGQA
jgi:hypothetical protein